MNFVCRNRCPAFDREFYNGQHPLLEMLTVDIIQFALEIASELLILG
jgi:hypothetical protein